MKIDDRIKEEENKFKMLEVQLTDPAVLSDPKKLQDINRAFQSTKQRVDLAHEYQSMQRNLENTQKTLSDPDPEIRALAETELAELEEKLPEMEQRLQLAFIPPDPTDANDAIIEIRAGTGGNEAALFAGDLFRMYHRFAEKTNRSVEIASQSRSDLGGLKEIIFDLRGEGAYGDMKYESGVHRVQRVPETEKAGRIHTSTATVAVFPKIEEKELKIDPKDLTIEATTSTGHGGQSVNTTYSASRITHNPTGITAYCQEERSQKQNKERALDIIRARVYAQVQEKKRAVIDERRRRLIGTAMRAEKIRTYNFPQDRVTDHRIKKSWHDLPGILDGELDDMISKLNLADQG